MQTLSTQMQQPVPSYRSPNPNEEKGSWTSDVVQERSRISSSLWLEEKGQFGGRIRTKRWFVCYFRVFLMSLLISSFRMQLQKLGSRFPSLADTIFQADAQSLELPSGKNLENSFDMVFTSATLHWCKRDPGGVLESVKRCLKPGGRFVGEFGGFMNCCGECFLESQADERSLTFFVYVPQPFGPISTRFCVSDLWILFLWIRGSSLA